MATAVACCCPKAGVVPISIGVIASNVLILCITQRLCSESRKGRTSCGENTGGGKMGKITRVPWVSVCYRFLFSLAFFC